MTAKEFREAGLDKLSEEELRALNAWVQRNLRLAEPGGAMSSAAAAGAAVPPSASASADLRGFENGERTEIKSRIAVSSGPSRAGAARPCSRWRTVWSGSRSRTIARRMYAENPAVTIFHGTFGSWRLKVEVSNRTTLVKRLK
jgi:hypothetical protein